MTEPTRLEVARILITCDTSPLGEAALDAAAALARQLDAELMGLFVENDNLLRMAALPFAREFALSGAAARPVEAGELVRLLRAQAETVRSALSDAAQRMSVPWSFQVVRGGLPDSVLAVMRAPDLAVFGHAGQFAVAPNGRGRPQQRRLQGAAVRQPIVTIYDDTPAADRALIAGHALAEAHRTGMVVLVIAGDAAGAARLRERVLAQLGEHRVSLRFHTFASRDALNIRAAADSHHAAILLWHGVQTPDERKTLATLVDVLKCPVVLVS